MILLSASAGLSKTVLQVSVCKLAVILNNLKPQQLRVYKSLAHEYNFCYEDISEVIT